MRLTEGFRRSVVCAEKAVARLIADQVPPMPHNYEVWYTYFEGANPALNGAIDSLISGGCEVDCSRLEELYDAHVADDRSGTRVEEISGRVAQEIAALANSVRETSGSARKYAGTLSSAAASLASSHEPEELVDVVRELIEATARSEEKTRSLEQQLSKSEVELKDLREDLAEISREAVEDALTQLGNRRHFDRSLKKAMACAEEKSQPLSLLFADIDRFKAFNDRHGHVAGDQVLKLVAGTLKGVVRGGDIACRYGGEEFAVILPSARLKEALEVGHRLRTAVASRDFVLRPSGEKLGRVSLSVGVAQFAPGEALQQFVQRADTCLYLAKAAGRNRLVSEVDMTSLQQRSASDPVEVWESGNNRNKPAA